MMLISCSESNTLYLQMYDPLHNKGRMMSKFDVIFYILNTLKIPVALTWAPVEGGVRGQE